MSVVVAPALEIRQRRPPSYFAAIPDLWALTKPEVNLLIVVATFAGFYLGCSRLHPFPAWRLVVTLLGTLFVASSAGALNQLIESGHDARMRRTARRPVAAGRVQPTLACWFGISLAAAGAISLFVLANALAGVLALITLLTYLFVYTPLKRKSPLCTLAGAFAGAMPPLIGWAAASGSIASIEAWELYAILFFWQFPHFMAIAWIYREDYARAGYFILPAQSPYCFLTWFTVVPSIGLFLTSLAAAGRHIFPFAATVIVGLCFLFSIREQLIAGSKAAARRLLKITIVYLLVQVAVLALAKR